MGMIKSCLFLLGGSWGCHKRKTLSLCTLLYNT
ncbi:hypothetical protein MUK42_33650 [Musa troglodytarum]|uniref:Uncharacterized protein n=1 Tax=Musa troglodytarum TaxID=320322 RepID=A0A9E7EF79_9LILI|nr:hypothetical protein MUK42_33632 [Musa troglodytarum]URD75816.1 hypothetical protein MUK42_33650 [Musa troglodytarum]